MKRGDNAMKGFVRAFVLLLAMVATVVPAHAAKLVSSTLAGQLEFVSGSQAIISATKVGAVANIYTVSATNISATNLSVGGGSALPVNISTSAGGYVSATNIYALNISATTITNSQLPIATAYISTTGSSCSVLDFTGSLSGTCTRITTGQFGISGTFTTSTYKPVCSVLYATGGSGIFLGATGSGGSVPKTDGFKVATLSVGGSANYIDNVQFSCVVYK